MELINGKGEKDKASKSSRAGVKDAKKKLSVKNAKKQ